MIIIIFNKVIQGTKDRNLFDKKQLHNNNYNNNMRLSGKFY